MKKLLVLSVLLIVVLTWNPAFAADSWSVAGPEGLTIRDIAVHPSDSGIIYLGTYGGVYKTVDGGNHWRLKNSGIDDLLEEPDVFSVIIHPDMPDTLYIGLHGVGVYKSENAGETWMYLGVNDSVRDMVLHPQTPDTMYVATWSGIYKTTNGGLNWALKNSGLTKTNVNTLANHADAPETIFAGVGDYGGFDEGGVFISTDGGENWTEVRSVPFSSVDTLAIAPSDANTIYAGGDFGIEKSTDGGVSWNSIFDRITKAIGIPANAPNTIYSGGYNGFHHSTDGGATWTTELQNETIDTLTICPENPDAVLAGASWVGVFIRHPVIHVKKDAAGTADGASWANAYNDLQSAIGASLWGHDIWVAAGTYVPSIRWDAAVPRSETFVLKKGVGIYGGFAGTETDRDQRDVSINKTILSGDIGVANDLSDNCYHVVLSPYTDASAVLDGVTITGGNADGDQEYSHGGGLFNVGGSPALTSIVFTENTARAGGAVLNLGFQDLISADPTMTDIEFRNNTAVYAGGGMFNEIGSPRMTNVEFVGNTAGEWGAGLAALKGNPSITGGAFRGNICDQNGGGMFVQEGSAVVENVTFEDNVSRWAGGGMLNYHNSSPTLRNVQFINNKAEMETLNPLDPNFQQVSGGGMANINNSSPSLIDVTFQGNSADFGGGGMMNSIGSNPKVYNTRFIDNSAKFGGGGMANNEASHPVLTNVVFFNNQSPGGIPGMETVAGSGGGMGNQAGSNPVLNHVTFSGNMAALAGGGLGSQDNSSPTLVNSILWGNTAGFGGDDFYIDGTGTPNVQSSIIGGVVGSDPNFVDEAGGNLRLQVGSPAIDAGSTAALPVDEADLDGDSNNTEPLPVDLVWNSRTSGLAPDLGAYEYAENRALLFDGLQNSVNCGHDESLNLTGPMTIEAWIHPSGWGETDYGFGRIIDKDGYFLFLHGEGSAVYNNHSLVFAMRDSTFSLRTVNTPQDSIQLNTWQHIAVTRDGSGTVKIYINGVQQTVDMPGGDLASDSIGDNQNKDLMIGERADGQRAFEGMMEEIRIWNMVRGQSDIESAMSTVLTGTETGLVGYWNMEAGGIALQDGSPEGNDGVMSGAIRVGIPPLERLDQPFGLTEAIGVLQTLVGIDSGMSIADLDATQDSLVNLPDAVYILQSVADLR